MGLKLTYYSDVKEGKLQKNVSTLLARELNHFEGKRVEITLQRARAKRTTKQNRYLHLLFTIFRDALNELGNEFTLDDIKDLCKLKFAVVDVFNANTGEVIGQKIQGTSDMSKSEMIKFIDEIIIWAADYFHIVLPYPNEEFTLSFDE